MLGEGSLLHGISVGHFAPDLERGVASSTMLEGGQSVATELEMVVDASVAGQEALRMPC